jgi:hypothetical protein
VHRLSCHLPELILRRSGAFPPKRWGYYSRLAIAGGGVGRGGNTVAGKSCRGLLALLQVPQQRMVYDRSSRELLLISHVSEKAEVFSGDDRLFTAHGSPLGKV